MLQYYATSAQELLAATKIPMSVMNTPCEVFTEYAALMVAQIAENNKNNKRTVFICPCGPLDQYRVFARFVNELKLDLKNTWIINMDEYLTEDGKMMPADDPFSFRKCMNEALYSLLDPELIMPPEQRVFPDPENLNAIPELIERLGGVDIAFGGVALNGHVAFNEPQEGISAEDYAALSTRLVTLSAETRIKDAILSRGGAVDTVPERAVTIGMKEILGAKKVRLSIMLDMQRAVIRKACLGEPSAMCPVSLLQMHPDARLMVMRSVLEKPF